MKIVQALESSNVLSKVVRKTLKIKQKKEKEDF